MTTLRRLLALLLLAPAVAAQAPVFHPPLVPPGDLGSHEAGGVQRAPYVAAGGLGALAVWVDHRAEFHSPLAGEGGPDVFALRLGGDGAPLDAVALRMPFEVGDKEDVRAAWNGTAWLVTWENQDPEAFTSHARLVLGARVSADGVLLDDTPIVIKNDQETVGGTTTVASDGSDWIVTAQGHPSNNAALVAVRVLPDGSVANPGGTVLANLQFAQGAGDLEYADGQFLFVYGSSSVRGYRFRANLAGLGGTFSIGAGTKPRVATDGSDFLVTWEDPGIGRTIRARRVDGDTGALDAPIAVTPATNGDFNWDPDVAWNGTHWFVTCTDSVADGFRLARFTPELTPLDPGGALLPLGSAAAQANAELAALAGGVAVVFETYDLTQNWPGEVRAARVSDALATGPVAPLSLSATRQAFPALAAGDGQFLAVFAAEQDDTVVIEAQRFDAFGAPLDTEPLELAAGNRFGEPRAAWNGAHWLVVWEDRKVVSFETDDVVLGARITAEGTLLDPAPLELMDGGKPDVAANGDTFLVVSSDPPSADPQLRFPYARRVASDGTPLGAAVQLGGLFARYPRVAPLGDGWLVTWQRNFSHDNPNSVAHAARVAADGSAFPNVLVDGAAGFGGASRPNVASAGDSALLVWQDDFTGLAARRMLADGTLEPPFAVAPPPALPSLPDVAWNGEDYLVTWTDYRDLVGLWDFRGDIYAARVSEAGALLDGGGGVPVSTGSETEFAAAAAGDFGAHLLGWTELLPDAPHATLRLVLRRESPWSSAGGGVGGPAGAPLLLGRGDPLSGNALGFRLTGGPALAQGALIVGLAALDAPFKGGTLVPALDLLKPVTTDASGGLAFAPVLPAGVPSGLTLHVQCWLADGAAPAGFAGSNAVLALTP